MQDGTRVLSEAHAIRCPAVALSESCAEFRLRARIAGRIVLASRQSTLPIKSVA